MEPYLVRIGVKDDWVRLTKNKTVAFGRHATSDVLLYSEFVSRWHCKIDHATTGISITDLNSTNGVHINDTRILPSKNYPLNFGDTVEIGKPPDNEDQWNDLQHCDRFVYTLKEEDSQKLDKCLPPPKVHKSIYSYKKLQEKNKVDVKHGNTEILKNERTNKQEIEDFAKKEAMLNQRLEDMKKKELIEKEISRKKEEFMKKREEQLHEELLKAQEFAIAKAEEAVAVAEKEAEERAKQDVVGKLEEELQCIICSELFVKSTTLNCGHTFCKFCIEGWLKKENICPICRCVVKSQNRSLVLDNCIDNAVAEMPSSAKERRLQIIKERDNSDVQVNPKKRRKRTRR